MHLAILCSAYASVRFVGNHTVRQDLAIELCMYKTQLLSAPGPLTLPYKARGRGPNNPKILRACFNIYS